MTPANNPAGRPAETPTAKAVEALRKANDRIATAEAELAAARYARNATAATAIESGASFRQVAKTLDVSHEAVRQMVKHPAPQRARPRQPKVT